jgi:hypothetical protein
MRSAGVSWASSAPDLVSALDVGSPLFKRLWKERHIQPLHTMELPLEHVVLGRLRFYSVRTIPADGTGNSVNRLFLLSPAAWPTPAA